MAQVLRGVAAVERVIASQAERDALGIGAPQPLDAAALEKLTLPGGKPLAPSMKRWLAYDASLLPWFRDGALQPLALDALVEAELDDAWAAMFRPLAREKLTAPCLKLVGGSDSRRLLYLGEPDADGEYPVLWIDTDEVPAVGLFSPDFGTWLLEEAGLLEGFQREGHESLADVDGYTELMDAAAQKNLGGVLTLEMGDVGFPAPEGAPSTVQFKPFPEAE